MAAKGILRLKWYDPGKLVEALQILGAVSSGKIAAGYTAPGYDVGKIPAIALFSTFPFGPEITEYLAWAIDGDGEKLYQQLIDDKKLNVKVVYPCGAITANSSGWYRKPINNIKELKNLKIRFFGLGGLVMQKLGASTTLLSGGDIFPALQKGAIDAAEFASPAMDERLGLYKVAKYNYYPGWHEPSAFLTLYINKKVWAKITKQQKSLIKMQCNAISIKMLAKVEYVQGAAIARMRKKGVKTLYWSPEMLKHFKNAWNEVLKEKRKDPEFNKIWENFQRFDKQYQYWHQVSLLPRKHGNPESN